MTITSSLRFLYIFWGSGLLCGGQTEPVLDMTHQTLFSASCKKVHLIQFDLTWLR